MLRLITGADGTGKTLMACQVLREEVEKNDQRRKEGKPERAIYTNIEGYCYRGVTVLDRKDTGHDWRKLPDNSIVVYDEAHKIFPGTGKPGQSSDARITNFDEHRHRAFDFYFLTQWPSKIHHVIRQMVQDHRHLTRAMGLGRSGMRKWNRVQVDPYDEKVQETAEEEIWVHPKECFGDYVSAVEHTDSYKFKMPKAVWKLLSMAVTAVIVFWALWVFVFKPMTHGKAEEGPEKAQARADLSAGAPPAPVQISTTPPRDPKFDYLDAPRLAVVGGFIVGERCRILDLEGFELDITQDRCRQAVKDGIPVSIAAGNEARSRPGLVDEKASPGKVDAVSVADPFGFGDGTFRGQQARYGQMRTAAIPADYEGSSIH